ncbi:MAG TPA: hypothetical protein VGU45_01035 [Microvirga sp.]|jgi:hypothetical protein|nr:hypothetical protein [Microvirga sp.]
MFTLEINGTAIVVTNADEEQARELLESDEFKDDLKTLTADGEPLWDGKAPLKIRPATEDEQVSFEDALNDEEFEDEEGDDETDDDDEPIDIVFLVEVDEVDEEDEDDTASA